VQEKEITEIEVVEKTLKERKRMLIRAANLSSVEDLVFSHWMSSSRGLKRSLGLLLLATRRSKSLERIERRFGNFTSISWTRRCMGKWKLYTERHRFHGRRTPFREKRRMAGVILAWRKEVKKGKRITNLYQQRLLARMFGRWRKGIDRWLERKHGELYAKATVDRLRMKKVFNALRKHWKGCVMPVADYSRYSPIADRLFTRFIFRRWSRSVLGIRLANNWDSEGFRKICSQSRVAILKTRFTRWTKFVVMNRIGRQRLIRTMFSAWSDLVERGRGKFELYYKADNHGHVRRLRWGIRRFKIFVGIRRKFNVVRGFRLKVVYSRWVSYARDEREERLRGILSVNHYFTTLLKKTFASLNWKERRVVRYREMTERRVKVRVVREWRKVASVRRIERRVERIIDR